MCLNQYIINGNDYNVLKKSILKVYQTARHIGNFGALLYQYKNNITDYSKSRIKNINLTSVYCLSGGYIVK